MNLSRKTLYLLVGAISILLLVLWLLPKLSANSYLSKFTPQEITYVQEKDRVQLEKNAADIENGARLTLAQIIGGLGLLIGLYFTYLNVKAAQDNAKTAQDNAKTAQKSLYLTEETARKNILIAEEGKITDRFSKAVELLGSDKLDTRLGGIYALERIARDSQKDHWTVMEVLTAFVRENAPLASGKKVTATTPREAIQAAMTVIGRRKWTETETQQLNLQYVNLEECILRNANLSKANLRGTKFFRSDMDGAILTDTFLSGVNLVATNLNKVVLNGAMLCKNGNQITDFRNAILLTAEQVLSTHYFEEAKFPPDIEKELKKGKAKQAKEKKGAGE